MTHFPLHDDHPSGPTSRPITLILTPVQLCFLADDLNSTTKPSCKSTPERFSMEFTSPLKSTKPAYATLPGKKKKLLLRFLRHQCENPWISKANSKTNHRRGGMGVTKKKSRHNTFKSWLKDAPKIPPPTNIMSKSRVPTVIHQRETTYLITNFSNETPPGVIIILGTEVLVIFPLIHTLPLSCW